MNSKELLDIICMINECGGVDETFLSLHSNGSKYNIVLDEAELWKEYDDERKYNDKINEYEPMDDFLIRKLKERVSLISDMIKKYEDNKK